MRFKSGMKVEVLSKKEATIGSWLCAEIISGNGHTYAVKYDTDAVVERVPRKEIRPCPPPVVVGADRWVPGDLVEVFHSYAWKTAVVMETFGENYFFVRLVGFGKEFGTHKSRLRIRQCWVDDEWTVMRKVVENCGMPIGTGSKKRGSLFGQCDFEAYPGAAARKKRLIEREGGYGRICSVHPSLTFEKVDAFNYPNDILGENHVHSRENDSLHVESAVSVDTDSCVSSVGSCSVLCSYSPNLSFSNRHDENTEDLYIDAESSYYGSENEIKDSPSLDDNVGGEVHRSKLHSYFSTIEALYSSGPLSWEDEEKLTRLRDDLHISDDEHLMMLRNLISVNHRFLNS